MPPHCSQCLTGLKTLMSGPCSPSGLSSHPPSLWCDRMTAPSLSQAASFPIHALCQVVFLQPLGSLSFSLNTPLPRTVPQVPGLDGGPLKCPSSHVSQLLFSVVPYMIYCLNFWLFCLCSKNGSLCVLHISVGPGSPPGSVPWHVLNKPLSRE